MKDLKEPLLILLVLFILIGFAYGPMKKSGSSGNSIFSNKNSQSSIGTKQDGQTSDEIKDAEEKIKELEKSLGEAKEANRSPYYEKIRMSKISGLNQKSPDKEYLTLTTNLKNGEAVKITGWYLKSEITGYYAVIGQAALLPFPFTKTESDVILKNKDKVILTKGFSPIGISFRTNICTGYFEENRTFYPNLQTKCPKAGDENLPTFSTDYDRNEECIKIIERIGRCTTKGNEFVRDLADTVGNFCKTYITTQINYNTCVANHFSDTDFPGQEYRLYLNKFGPLWRVSHDTVNLHDSNGLVVDTISW